MDLGRPGPHPRADRLRAATIVDPGCGSRHLALELFELGSSGTVQAHVMAAERHVYVLQGAAHVQLDGRGFDFAEGSYALVPAGVTLAWQARDPGIRWLEARMPAPAPLTVDVSGPTPESVREALDDVRGGAPVTGTFTDDALVMPDIPYAQGKLAGAAIAPLLGAARGATQGAMFIVEYVPGGHIASHDHPFDEAYLVLSGQVDAVVDGVTVTLAAGDALWAGVACSHAFVNRSETPVRWLELQAPLPPARNAARFLDDWRTAAANVGAAR